MVPFPAETQNFGSSCTAYSFGVKRGKAIAGELVMLGISLRSNSSVKGAWSSLEYLALFSIAFQNFDLLNQYLLNSWSVPGCYFNVENIRVSNRVSTFVMGSCPS